MQEDTPRIRGYFCEPLPHESQKALFSPCATRGSTGGEAGGASDRKYRCTMATNSGDTSESKFLTVAEVAAMMRVSKMTVYRLVHNGDLPAVRVGRSFRVLEKDVDEYLRKSFYSAG
jgi:excisionase family DNA binding protein